MPAGDAQVLSPGSLRDRMPAADRTELDAALKDALVETGAVGATARQLASRLEDRPDRVEAALAHLRLRGDVLRLGRGL